MYSLFSLVTAIIEEAILILLLLWVLPWLGVSIPVWLVIVMALAWGAWSYLTYHLGKRLVGRRPAVGAETLVGARCRTTTPLSPVGYVQVGNELWRACSKVGDIDAEVEVVIVGLKGVTLFVMYPQDPQASVSGRQSNERGGHNDIS